LRAYVGSRKRKPSEGRILPCMTRGTLCRLRDAPAEERQERHEFLEPTPSGGGHSGRYAASR
jgi:hypothetical protein